MELSKLQHGRVLTLEVTPLTDVGAQGISKNGCELTLTRVGDHCALILPGQQHPVLLTGSDPLVERELRRIAAQDLPRLCWLVAVRAKDDQVHALTIQIHEFSQRVHLPQLSIGVDEKLVSDIERQLSRRLSIEAARSWLAEQLLLSPVAIGQQTRGLLIGRPNSEAPAKRFFRILGARYALDVRQEGPEGGWLAFRLTRPRTPQTPDQYRPISLAEGAFEFVDRTIVGQMREGMATQLDQIVRTADSYLAVWQEYQTMEEQRLVQEARRFGWLSYDGRNRTPDGCWTFQLSAESQWTPSQLWQGTNTDKDLEASTEVPELIVGAPATDSTPPSLNPSSRNSSRPTFRGAYAGSDSKSIKLRPDHQDTEIVPPERGYIHISLRGDLTRIRRRRDAHQRIVTAQNSIPQLALLLEDRPVPVRRVQALEPLSAAAKAKFRASSPTPRQVEAIRVALNTPDIAVIQGPPGTGKTRTIAAIVERIAEIAKEQNDPFDRVLLTSFQHDAVENVAAITEIFGLPAMKIGRRRGEHSDNLPLKAWTQRTTAGLEADLAASPRKPLKVLLEKIRMRHASYVQSPGTEAEATRMLLELRDLVSEHLPAALSNRIASVIYRLKLGSVGLDGERQDAICAVRGLRTQPDAFSDDGPQMAWRVLDHLSSGPWLSLEDTALLQEAKDWASAAVPSFLPLLESLRNRLLDILQATTPPSRTPLVNAEVVDVLDELRLTIENLARSTVGEGTDLAVEQLIQDLRTDPEGLREVIERYTVVLAATCQQAVSERMIDVLTEDVEFENVIVDEASRANPLDLLIPMSRAARRVILVGDHRQLPHLLEPDVERELEQSIREETRDQIRKSLFERLFLHVKNLEATDGIKRWVTLDTQFRMHPVLGTFVSNVFYKAYGEAFGSPDRADENPLFAHGLGGQYEAKLAVWKNIAPSAGGEERAGYSWRRRSEANWIAAEARHLLEEAPGLSFGVISFYNAQVDAIKEAMMREGLTTLTDDGNLVVADAWSTTTNAQGEPCERLRVGTVDAFQGKEFDIVFLSVTRSNRIQATDEKAKRRRLGHLLLENRLCVAMSRQKRLLIVVGDSDMATAEAPALHEFLKLCRGKNGIIIQ
jgi:hypothetical protein